ncbi:VirB4-like conjugal transfer ATPase, CD1110 family [Ferviditalea candida]|uniref:ATP-binding protein n=1 Tax=Ferviditalea candida TaxID=3108399 RepID=A0ABU5ZKH0_9BACL|nr:ATP-binding protein [Paenibacillaceae bacterium T2]
MIKTLRRTIKQDKEPFVIPKSVQQAIPIRAIWPDGIFAVGNKFSKSFRFEDINYAVASKEDKETMFLSYSDLLNSFDSGATTKITIHNRRLNQADVESSILIPLREDEMDTYRREYNDMLLGKATGANGTIQEKYITISVVKKNVDEAHNYFARVGTELMAHFSRLGSKCTELDATDRLRILHDFFRVGEEVHFRFDLPETMRKGHSFKDYICPDTFEFASDHFRMGNYYGRVIFLREYASYIKDSMVAELCDLNRSLLLSLDVIPIPTDEAVREVESRLLGVETNITNWQRRQNRNNNFSAVVPYDMEQQRKESKEFLSDLTTRDQRMMFGLLTMVHVAESKEQLDSDTETLLTTARKHLCQFATLTYQQMDGLNTVLPYGLRKVHALRTLTTESTAVFIPFRAQEIMHPGGIYYGQNVISKNMIVANRKQLLNGNSFILGVSGSGKSFTAKREIVNQMLASDDDIILIDPEREYSALVNALGGETIHISATSPNHINAMDMNRDYGDGANPIILKSEFVLSLCEQLIGGHQLGAKEKSLIDRCTAAVYRKYLQSNYKGEPPTLQDFRAELLKQAEPEAQDIALAIELFTSGSLNTFAQPTNVNVHNRLICYDILDLGKQLLPIGMLVVLDNILNRITQNRAKGKNTFIFIDEIYLLFQHEYSANFLFTLWKRVRKYGAFCTGITQNVDDLLQSHTARTMLANSEFIVMLNQASTDRVELAELLNISDLQLSYITNVDAGNGLMKVGSSLVPFTDKFPRNTKLYRLMTTKPGEL